MATPAHYGEVGGAGAVPGSRQHVWRGGSLPPGYSCPDNSTLHMGKVYFFPLHISRVVLVLLRQRRGAAGTNWAPRSSTYEKQRAAPRASAYREDIYLAKVQL
jgi:hypothetical protein